MENSEWLYKCLETTEFLYGIFPFEVLNRMYRLRATDNLKHDELSYFLEETVSNYVLEDDEIESFRKLGYGTKILRPNLYSDVTDRVQREFEAMGIKPKQPVLKKVKVGRNDPCPCGLGKKYERYCLKKKIT